MGTKTENKTKQKRGSIGRDWWQSAVENNEVSQENIPPSPRGLDHLIIDDVNRA